MMHLRLNWLNLRKLTLSEVKETKEQAVLLLKNRRLSWKAVLRAKLLLSASLLIIRWLSKVLEPLKDLLPQLKLSAKKETCLLRKARLSLLLFSAIPLKVRVSH